jgi:hypothetical protein
MGLLAAAFVPDIAALLRKDAAPKAWDVTSKEIVCICFCNLVELMSRLHPGLVAKFVIFSEGRLPMGDREASTDSLLAPDRLYNTFL